MKLGTAKAPPALLLALAALLAPSFGCASAMSEAPQSRPRLVLEPAGAFACEGVEGEVVVLVHLDWGAIAIAPESFAGSQPVGRIDDGALYLSIPGLRMPEVRLAGHCDRTDHKQLWGRLISPRGLTGKPGCAALERPGTDADLDARFQTVTRQILAGEQ